MNTDDLILALRDEGLAVLDLRGQLPKHKTKTFKMRAPETLKGIVFHHTAMDGRGLTTVEKVAKYHVGPNHVSKTGAPGILYSACIIGDGRVTINHDIEVATWSQGYKERPGDENQEFLAVLVLGNFNSASNPTGEHPTFEQLRSVISIFSAVKELWGWDDNDIYGHFDFGKPACPGDTLETIIRSIRSNAPSPSLPTIFDVSTKKGRQESLKELGYYTGRIDGLWGANSKAALVAFQRSVNLIADGLWGPNTQRKIIQEIEETLS